MLLLASFATSVDMFISYPGRFRRVIQIRMSSIQKSPQCPGSYTTYSRCEHALCLLLEDKIQKNLCF